MSLETPENKVWYEFWDRLQDPSFVNEVKNNFADLLEDRATEPERQSASAELFAMGEEVRAGKKIKRRPGPLGILRGVFFDGPMEKYRVGHAEIDQLEELFFEE
jgi:hypothetical protein